LPVEDRREPPETRTGMNAGNRGPGSRRTMAP
jgi:hypothetical protein